MVFDISSHVDVNKAFKKVGYFYSLTDYLVILHFFNIKFLSYGYSLTLIDILSVPLSLIIYVLLPQGFLRHTHF